MAIVSLSRQIKDPVPPDATRQFDTGGAVLSAVGLVLFVMGILAADDNWWSSTLSQWWTPPCSPAPEEVTRSSVT